MKLHQGRYDSGSSVELGWEAHVQLGVVKRRVSIIVRVEEPNGKRQDAPEVLQENPISVGTREAALVVPEYLQNGRLGRDVGGGEVHQPRESGPVGYNVGSGHRDGNWRCQIRDAGDCEVGSRRNHGALAAKDGHGCGDVGDDDIEGQFNSGFSSTLARHRVESVAEKQAGMEQAIG